MSKNAHRVGVLVVNLGSPAELSVKAIRQFLRPFLMDKRVIDLPWALRAMIVYGLVLPFRPPKLIPQYRSIWLEGEGSPLLVYSERIVESLRLQLDCKVPVELGMRYGEPSMADAVESLMHQGVDKIVMLPLYPQYASSTTGSTQAELFRVLSDYQSVPAVEIIPPFYARPDYIRVQADVYRRHLQGQAFDHVLFSYHGLPVSHIRNDERHHIEVCAHTGECPAITADNAYCYRAQCFATSRALVAELGWQDSMVTTAFQSRFGKSQWIEPVTTEVMQRLAERGVKRLAIATPAFVVDCLESLEEIAVRAREDWLDFGGEELIVLPCLNDEKQWVEVMAQWLQPFVDSAE